MLREIPIQLIYPVYSGIIALGMILLVPRKNIQYLFPYGVAFGGAASVIIETLQKALNIGGHINFQPFGAFGLPFFPPLSWTLWFVIYFYFLPQKRILTWIYSGAAIFYCMMFANVLNKLGILQINPHPFWSTLIYYGLWIALATWGFTRLERNPTSS